MSRENEVLIPSPSGDRVIAFGAIRFHHSHLQSGRATGRGCGICSEGLGGALEADAQYQREEPKVAEGDGGDQEDDPTPPPDSWAS